MQRFRWILAGCSILVGACGSDNFNDVAPSVPDGSVDQTATADAAEELAFETGFDVAKDAGNDAGNDASNDVGKDAVSDPAKEATPCPSGFEDCDGDPANGCEADTTQSNEHCGECGHACNPSAHATSSCNKGTCELTCESGWLDCDAVTNNGCEVDPKTDPGSCSTCGNACPGVDHGQPACNNGQCAFTCDSGWADCDGNPANGCEVDTTTSVASCGSCGNACAGASHATPHCASSACAWTCDAGWGNCDNDPANGCEVDTTTSVAHCGACGQACGSANGIPSCAGSVCSIQCIDGWQNCDGLNPNGCESNGENDALNCGWCGHNCLGSACSLWMCAPVTVADNLGSVTALAEFGGDLYFATDTPATGRVRKVAKSGGAPVDLVAVSGNAASVAVDASGVYWVGSTGLVRSAPLSGGTPFDIVFGPSGGSYLRIDGANLLWATQSSPTIYRVAKVGGGPAQVGALPDSSLSGLVLDDTYAYGSMGLQNSILRVAKTGGTPSALVSGQANPRWLSIDSTTLYWTRYGEDVLVSMPKGGGAVTTLATAAGHVTAIQNAGADLYFSTAPGDIARTPKTGAVVYPMAKGQSVAMFLLVDATHLYWVTFAGGNTSLRKTVR